MVARTGERTKYCGGGRGGGGVGGYGKPPVLETIWRKAGRNTVVWAAVRGNRAPPPFETAEAVRLSASGFVMEEKGAYQVAALCGMDVRNFAQKGHFGGGGGGKQVSLDHRVEALFLLIITLAQYVVDDTDASGQAALRRSGNLSECFRVVAQGVRNFYAQNALVAASRQFQETFVKCFNEDLQEWAEEVTRRGLLLQQEPGSSFPGPRELGPMPLPPFEKTHAWISMAPVNLMHMAGPEEGVGGGEGGEGGRVTHATGFKTARGAGGGEGGTGGVGGGGWGGGGG